MLEEVIQENPHEVELRFIRLCIQHYSPKFLGYRDALESDRQYVMNNLYKMKDKQAKGLIFNYLHGAKIYSDDELDLLKR